jgi:ssDNA-binding Zn-finger/Zn-ribbon topoisomerase 1
VVYPCGAVIINDRLFVYYGGADMVVCVATATLNHFLEELVTNHKEAKPVSIQIVPRSAEEIFPPVKASCIKCGRMREIKNPRRVILKNMRHTIQGVCPWCGGKLSRFVKSNEKKKAKKKKSASIA